MSVEVNQEIGEEAKNLIFRGEIAYLNDKPTKRGGTSFSIGIPDPEDEEGGFIFFSTFDKAASSLEIGDDVELSYFVVVKGESVFHNIVTLSRYVNGVAMPVVQGKAKTNGQASQPATAKPKANGSKQNENNVNARKALEEAVLYCPPPSNADVGNAAEQVCLVADVFRTWLTEKCN